MRLRATACTAILVLSVSAACVTQSPSDDAIQEAVATVLEATVQAVPTPTITPIPSPTLVLPTATSVPPTPTIATASPTPTSTAVPRPTKLDRPVTYTVPDTMSKYFSETLSELLTELGWLSSIPNMVWAFSSQYELIWAHSAVDMVDGEIVQQSTFVSANDGQLIRGFTISKLGNGFCNAYRTKAQADLGDTRLSSEVIDAGLYKSDREIWSNGGFNCLTSDKHVNLLVVTEWPFSTDELMGFLRGFRAQNLNLRN